LPDGNARAPAVIIKPRLVERTDIGCLYHPKDARLRVSLYRSDHLLIISCIACSPPNELMRVTLPEEER